MRKTLLSIIALCGMTAAQAQVFEKVAVEEGVTTLHITKSAAQLQADYPDGAKGAWGSEVSMKWPAGYDMYTDDELSVTPYTPFAFGLAEWGKQTLVEAITGSLFYLNCGCTLAGPGSGDGFSEAVKVTSGQAIYGEDGKANGILKVTVKANGVLGFKAFEGGNNRSSGIYTLATAEEIAEGNKIIADADANDDLTDQEYDAEIARGNDLKKGHMVNWINYKKSLAVTEENPEPAEGDEHNVAATAESHDIYAEVEAGREYLLLCSDIANHNLYEITFQAGGSLAGISSVNAEKSVSKGIFNLAGQRVDTGYKGIIIKDGKKIVNK